MLYLFVPASLSHKGGEELKSEPLVLAPGPLPSRDKSVTR